MKTHILVVNLLDDLSLRRSRVMREIEVRGDPTPYKLAEAIVGAYGFDFDHAFGFFSRTGNDYLRYCG